MGCSASRKRIIFEVPEHNVDLRIARYQCLETSHPGEGVLIICLLTGTFDLVAPFPILFCLLGHLRIFSVAPITVYCYI